MRSVFLVCAFGVACLLVPVVPGCKSGEKGGATAAAADSGTYQCPMCKDTVTWNLNSKGLPAGAKTYVHSCPSCKKEWGSAVGSASTCGECAKKDVMCPACKKAGGQ